MEWNESVRKKRVLLSFIETDVYFLLAISISTLSLPTIAAANVLHVLAWVWLHLLMQQATTIVSDPAGKQTRRDTNTKTASHNNYDQQAALARCRHTCRNVISAKGHFRFQQMDPSPVGR